jgi:hypothetical protein
VHRDWRRRMRRGQVAVQDTYNQLVAESQVIHHFETVYVPGLLQTPTTRAASSPRWSSRTTSMSPMWTPP